MKSRDYVHYEMEFHFKKWSYIIFSSYISFTDLLLVYPSADANKTCLNYFRNTFKFFLFFFFVFLFCSRNSRDYVHYEMEVCLTK